MSTNSINSVSNNPLLLEPPRGVKWNSIFAGVAIALGSEILLNFLGLGLGLVTANPSSGNLADKISTASLIWLSLSGILSLAYAGWITGLLSNFTCKTTLAIHGVLVWCIATILTTAVTTTILGLAIGGPLSLISSNLAHLSANLPQQATEIGWNILKNKGELAEVKKNASEIVSHGLTSAGKASLSLFGAYFLSFLTAAGATISGGRRKNNYYS